MIKYFYQGTISCLLAGLCLTSSSLYARENWREGREEIAQADVRENNYQRPLRMGDWDFRENWQYDREAFFSGQTQGEAYRKHHLYGIGGIGYDPDEEYLDYLRDRRERMRDRYSHRDRNYISERQRRDND